MMLLVPVPWSRRVWAAPFLTALCWPAKKGKRQRHKSSAVSSARAPAPRQARPQANHGAAPPELAGLGRLLGYLLGDGGGGLVRRPAQTAVGVLPHGPVVYPGLAPVDIRYVLVCDPAGKLRMEAFFCTDLQATSVQILEWGVRRWSVEGTFEEARAHLGVETPTAVVRPRHCADHAHPVGLILHRDRDGSELAVFFLNPLVE
jgi:hypothetical protein